MVLLQYQTSLQLPIPAQAKTMRTRAGVEIHRYASYLPAYLQSSQLAILTTFIYRYTLFTEHFRGPLRVLIFHTPPTPTRADAANMI